MIPSGGITDAEIEERYGTLLDEFFDALVVDVTLIEEMVEHGTKVMQRASWQATQAG